METKVCERCGRELPVSSFNKYRWREDGLMDMCKSCYKEHLGNIKDKKTAKLDEIITSRAMEMSKKNLVDFSVKEMKEELERRGLIVKLYQNKIVEYEGDE